MRLPLAGSSVYQANSFDVGDDGGSVVADVVGCGLRLNLRHGGLWE